MVVLLRAAMGGKAQNKNLVRKLLQQCCLWVVLAHIRGSEYVNVGRGQIVCVLMASPLKLTQVLTRGLGRMKQSQTSANLAEHWGTAGYTASQDILITGCRGRINPGGIMKAQQANPPPASAWMWRA